MKKKLQTKKKRSFFELSHEERERELERFDREIDIEQDTRPLTAKERALFERMRNDKPHISITVSNGNHDVVIVLDDELWMKAAAFARKNRTTLPKVVDRAIRGLLAFAE